MVLAKDWSKGHQYRLLALEMQCVALHVLSLSAVVGKALYYREYHCSRE